MPEARTEQPAKVAKVAEHEEAMVAKPRASPILPFEILHLIICHLFLDVSQMSNSLPHHWLTQCGPIHCRQGGMKWFWQTVPAVHSSFLRLLAPGMFSCLEIPKKEGSKKNLSDRDIALLSFGFLAPMLECVKHLRIDYEALVDLRGLRRKTARPMLWIPYIFRICLGATNLETLELGDLVNTTTDRSNLRFGYQPFGEFHRVKPLQFDLTCSGLMSRLSSYLNLNVFKSIEIFDSESEDQPKVILGVWGKHALQVLIQSFHDILQNPQKGIGFPNLKHVLMMDGNVGISVKD